MRMEPVHVRAGEGGVVAEREQARALVARLREQIGRIEAGRKGPHPPLLRNGAPSPEERGQDRKLFPSPLERGDRRGARRWGRSFAEEGWSLGIEAVDRALPLRGLVRDGVHDVSPLAYGDFPAACGFALALAVRRLVDVGERRPLLWCRLAQEVREYGRLYGHGLESLGLPRERLLTVTLQKPVAQLWTMEEALKSGALAVVIGDMPSRQTDLTVTRRLSLAAQAGKCAGLLVFNTAHEGATASHTRWIVGAARSQGSGFDHSAPGAPAWQIELVKVRSGRPGSWVVRWQKEDVTQNDATHGFQTHGFHLVSGLSGGALHPGATEGAGPRAAAGPALRAG
jgi:protein ImuA